MKVSHLTAPYTQAERDRDRAERERIAELIHIRRKVLKSGQNYNIPGNKASKARDDRLLGESKAS
jgi:hypothetical protein